MALKGYVQELVFYTVLKASAMNQSKWLNLFSSCLFAYYGQWKWKEVQKLMRSIFAVQVSFKSYQHSLFNVWNANDGVCHLCGLAQKYQLPLYQFHVSSHYYCGLGKLEKVKLFSHCRHKSRCSKSNCVFIMRNQLKKIKLTYSIWSYFFFFTDNTDYFDNLLVKACSMDWSRS